MRKPGIPLDDFFNRTYPVRLVSGQVVQKRLGQMTTAELEAHIATEREAAAIEMRQAFNVEQADKTWIGSRDA